MNTYRRRLVVQDPKQIVLSDVPFQTGQEVEITLVPLLHKRIFLLQAIMISMRLNR